MDAIVARLGGAAAARPTTRQHDPNDMLHITGVTSHGQMSKARAAIRAERDDAARRTSKNDPPALSNWQLEPGPM